MEVNKIYIGDTLQTLKEFPSDFFDIIVTSPPYNKNKVAGKLVEEVKYKNSSDSKNEDEYQREQVEILDELHRVTKPYGHLFYNHKLRFLNGIAIHPMEWLPKSFWSFRQEIIWDRGIAANLRGWRFWQVEERIYWLQKGILIGEELKSKHAKMSSIWKIRPETKYKEHPAPFPIDLPTRCIYSIADEQKQLNILDPYCGVGTTLAAAHFMGHNYVGIDICPDYQDIFHRRLKDVEEHVSIEKELKLHMIKKSYADRKK